MSSAISTREVAITSGDAGVRAAAVARARARWQRLPKKQRDGALYDVRFRLKILRGNGPRYKAEATLLEMLFAMASIPTETR